MPTFYCHTETTCFAEDCEEIEADCDAYAAEEYAARLFDTECDNDRPIEVIVAETRDAARAIRFSVSRTITIRDDAREVGEVEIPRDDE